MKTNYKISGGKCCANCKYSIVVGYDESWYCNEDNSNKKDINHFIFQDSICDNYVRFEELNNRKIDELPI